jgi:tetratricopeptide (TPR) repeat protein
VADASNWIRLCAVGGAGAIPIVGGFLSKAVDMGLDHLDKKPDAKAISRQVTKLAVRVKQHGRLLDALLAALGDGSVEEPFHDPIKEFAEALENPDKPPKRIQQIFDRLHDQFGDFKAFRTDAEERFADIESRLDGHEEEIGKLKVLPTDGMEVVERHTHTDEIVRRPAPAPAPPTAVTTAPALPIFEVPHRKNPHFTGREDLLDSLHLALVSGKPAALTQAIAGLGGVGKTQLAVEYAHRHRGEYDLVWWVRCEEPAQFAADYAALAGPLQLPEKDAREQATAVIAVHRWLEANDGWLLIFDNVPGPAALHGPDSDCDYLPHGAKGHVIITSRHRAWKGLAEALTVVKWPRDDSVAFLAERTGLDDPNGADALADALGDLPLALEHAAAFIDETGCSFHDYVVMFREQSDKVLTWKPVAGTDYPLSVAATWELSFNKLSPEAADLLRLCAFLAPDDIPLDSIHKQAERLPEGLATVAGNTMALNEAVADLRHYSLVERDGDALAIHRLVQALVRDRLSDRERQEWCSAVVELINRAYPKDVQTNVGAWPACERLLPHALEATEYAETVGVTPGRTARLLNQVGVYQIARAAFTQARRSLERAVRIDEAAFGPDHPEVAPDLNNLGCVLQHLGDLVGAKKNHQRALRIDEAAFGPDHPRVASCLNNLGSALQGLGDLTGARENYERALRITEATLGPDHPHVAPRLNNLGSILQALGDLPGAKRNLERALQIDEAAFGPDHPNVAVDLNNIGSVLQAVGDLTGARKNGRRALRILRSTLGDDHPTTKIVRRNLEALGE